jgi:phage tail tape-measure protein
VNTTTTNTLVIGGSTVAGGALGSWASARLGAAYGLRLGPWGMVAGALVGTLVGMALSRAFTAEPQEAMPLEPNET